MRSIGERISRSRQLRPAFLLIPVVALALVSMLGCGVCGLTIPNATPAPDSPQVVVAVATPTPLPSEALERARAEERWVIHLVAQVSDSVVSIQVVRVWEDLPSIPQHGEAPYYQRSEATGFFFDRQGHVVTNHHVVEGAVDIQVGLANGLTVPARVVGADADSDLAVLQVEVPPELSRPLEMADSDRLQPGQRVIAIGNPYGFDHTVTSGIVSAVGRVVQQELGGYSMAQIIQTDAAINPGNSGGPLIDLNGRVVGVNAFLFSQSGASAGVGFAVPVNTVQRIVPALIEKGEYQHPWIGIRGLGLTPRMAQALNLPVDRGALVLEVIAGGPAERAGLRGGTRPVEVPFQSGAVLGGGDVILAIDGQPVASFDDLITYLQEHTVVGQEVHLKIMRGQEERTIAVKLGKRP